MMVGDTYRSSVLQLEVFILKLASIDRLASSTITISEITTLDHELLDNTVELGSLVTITLFTSCQSSKVFSSLGNSL